MIVWSGATFILRWSCIIGGNLNGILSFLRGTNGATLLEPKPVAGVSDGFLWAKTESCCCRQRCGGSTTTRLIAQPQISSEDFVMVIRDLSFYRTQVRPCLLLSMLTHRETIDWHWQYWELVSHSGLMRSGQGRTIIRQRCNRMCVLGVSNRKSAQTYPGNSTFKKCQSS